MRRRRCLVCTMYSFIISFIPLVLIICTTYYTLPYVLITSITAGPKSTIKSFINVHENDGCIHISIVTDGSLSSFIRRNSHYFCMTVVTKVIEHLFF